MGHHTNLSLVLRGLNRMESVSGSASWNHERRPLSSMTVQTRLPLNPSCLPPSSVNDQGLSPSQFRRVLPFIGNRLSSNLTLSQLATEAGLSIAYFSQRLKSSTGTSPHQYLLGLRVCRAVKGVVFTVQRLLPLMKDGGSIILNSSITESKGMESFSMCSGAKAAVRNLARGWATDLKARKIRVNAISPGVVITPGYSTLGMNDHQIKEYAAASSEKTPLGRTGEPEEIAKAVLFLASDDSSFVNAENLVVDGGYSLA